MGVWLCLKGRSSKIKTRKTSKSHICENCYPRKFPAIRYPDNGFQLVPIPQGASQMANLVLAQTSRQPKAAQLYKHPGSSLTNGTILVMGRLYVPFDVRTLTTHTLPSCPGTPFPHKQWAIWEVLIALPSDKLYCLPAHCKKDGAISKTY